MTVNNGSNPVIRRALVAAAEGTSEKPRHSRQVIAPKTAAQNLELRDRLSQ